MPGIPVLGCGRILERFTGLFLMESGEYVVYASMPGGEEVGGELFWVRLRLVYVSSYLK